MPAELGPVRVRRVPGLRAAELAAAWDRLAAEALEENPFFTAAYMLAGLRHLNERSVPDLLCVERAPIDGGAALLIGVLPLETARFRYGVPLPLGVAASHVFQTSGTPLLHRDHAADAADALLGALCRDPAVRGRALLPHLRLAGATARLLGERAGPAGLRTATLCDLRRPVLRRGPEPAAAYLARRLAPKRLRELARTERRLGEQGALGYRHTRDPAELARAVEDFLRVEASGWKGRAGTAFLSRPDTARFAREAFTASCGGVPLCSADILSLDGQAIALGLNLQVGRTAFAVKCCYDESYARFAPGLLLERKVIESLFGAGWADEIDSCITEPGHVIGELWEEAEPVGTLVLQPAARGGFDLLAAERARRHARREVRRLVHAARGRADAAAARLRGLLARPPAAGPAG